MRKVKKIVLVILISFILSGCSITYNLTIDEKTIQEETLIHQDNNNLEELKTICKCGRKAVLNGRKINKKFVFEGEQVAIDNVDNVEYESLCGHCYFNFKNEK